MIGQDEESAEKALEILKEAAELIRRGIARCKSRADREVERELEMSLLKASKVR